MRGLVAIGHAWLDKLLDDGMVTDEADLEGGGILLVRRPFGAMVSEAKPAVSYLWSESPRLKLPPWEIRLEAGPIPLWEVVRER